MLNNLRTLKWTAFVPNKNTFLFVWPTHCPLSRSLAPRGPESTLKLIWVRLFSWLRDSAKSAGGELILLSPRRQQGTLTQTWHRRAATSRLPETPGLISSISSSVQFSRSVVSYSLWPHESKHARPPCPPTPRVLSNFRPLSRWCHPAISSSVVLFSCPQSLPASESFPMSQFFTWGGQSTEVSALASFLPKNTQGWSPLEWTGWISLQSRGLSRLFSNTTVQKHQFFSSQLSSQSNSHIHTWLPQKI